MDSVFNFDGLTLEVEAGTPGDALHSSTGMSVALFSTTPLSALSGSTGGIGWVA
jgi:hypothetical protein